MRLRKLFRGDTVIWVVFFLLSVISLVAVYSSIGLEAYTHRGHSPTGLFLKHVGIVAATYVIAVAVARVNYRYFSRFSMLGYWLAAMLLVVMLVLHGRWLRLPVIGQFQPSEVAKVVLVVFVARILTLSKEHVEELGTFLKLLIAIGFIAAMVLPENFSTAALIFISCYLVMLFGGVNKRYWWQLLGVMVVVAGIGLYVAYNRYEKSLYLQEGTQTEAVLQRSGTWGHRLYSWKNPNPEELSQENMARMAVARGGVVRFAPGSTVHARLMTQAHNDFIYAIIIEETGMLGGLVVFLLYAVFYFRCVRVAWRCNGRFGALTVAGLGTMIYLQALVNMCVAVGVLPVTGQTLPFVSYGGTAYMLLGLALGMIQAVASEDKKEAAVETAEAATPVETNDNETTEKE